MAPRSRPRPQLCLELLESRQMLNGMPLAGFPPSAAVMGGPAVFRPLPAFSPPVAGFGSGSPMHVLSGWNRGEPHGSMLPPARVQMAVRVEVPSVPVTSSLAISIEERPFVQTLVVSNAVTVATANPAVLRSLREHVAVVASAADGPQAPTLVAADDDAALLGQSLHQSAHAGSEAAIGPGSEPAALAAQVAAFTGRPITELTLLNQPFVAGMPASNQDLFVPGRDQAAIFLPRASGSGPALAQPVQSAPEETPPPEAKNNLPVEPPPPESAGLLTSGLRLGLTTLEGAFRSLLDPDFRASSGTHTWLRWLGVCSGFFGAGLAYVVAHRRRSSARIALPGTGRLGEVPFSEEELL